MIYDLRFQTRISRMNTDSIGDNPCLRFPLILLLLSTLNSQLPTSFAQGSLTPPGAPAPTMKSLAQIEPRTPISSLPFTITNAGSYFLTTNLTGQAGTNGITISADHVTIDLNGFAIIGVANSGVGVLVSGPRSYLSPVHGPNARF